MYLGKPSRRRLRGLGDGWKRYSEVVTERFGDGKYTILLREKPLEGLRGLGEAGAQILGTSAPIAAIGTTIGVSSLAAGTALGSFAGPIGAGVGALVGIIAGLWSAHAARAKGAQTENVAINSALQAFDGSLQAVFQAANSGSVTGAQAAQVCQQILQQFWQGMAPFTTGPGRADASNLGANCGTVNPASPCSGMLNGHKCNSSCTATCCVGCQDLVPTIASAISALSSPTGGTMTACNVAGSSYGASGRGSYTLTYTPPQVSSVAGAAASLTSDLSVGSLTSDSVLGIPLWLLLLGGGVGIYAITRR